MPVVSPFTRDVAPAPAVRAVAATTRSTMAVAMLRGGEGGRRSSWCLPWGGLTDEGEPDSEPDAESGPSRIR